MHRLVVATIAVVVPTVAFGIGRASASDVQSARTTAFGSIIEHDSLVAVREPGPHRGGGETTAYPFFAKARDLSLVFRKRALHPGAAIGYHRQDSDEIYYVLSGQGELTLDGVRHVVGPGTALLTRPGSAHGLRQTGTDDLVILISYQSAPRARRDTLPRQ